jgi:hypothetical protein
LQAQPEPCESDVSRVAEDGVMAEWRPGAAPYRRIIEQR